MPKIDRKTCLCCGESLPVLTQFGNYNGNCASICLHCEALSVHAVANLTAQTINRRLQLLKEDKNMRREVKKAERRALYSQTGKRCACGHHYKPVDQFNACTSRADGLQPNCKACDALRVTLLAKPGGLATWRLTRDAMRAAAAAQVQIAAQSDVNEPNHPSS